MIGDGGHASVIKSFAHDAFVVAVGDNATRKSVVEKLHPEMMFDVVIHSTAVVDQTAEIGAGTVIMAGAVIQAYAKIGRHCIVNTLASCDHHTVLEDFVHIAPGAHLCGNVHVGEGALVGVGVGIEPGIHIPAWSIIKREKYVITLRSNETV